MALTACVECGTAVRGQVEECPQCGAPQTGPAEDIRRMPRDVVLTFVQHAEDYLKASVGKQLALAFMAGAFITFGGMLSVALTVGVKPLGISELVLGAGFTAGFALVILSGAALFTEVNVLLPEIILSKRKTPWRLFRFWGIVYLGNAVGAIAVGALLNWGHVLGPEQTRRLIQLLHVKLQFQHTGVSGWFRAVGSGIAANWMVGMAAFLATAGRTLSGKILGISLPIITFVALGVQHAPANMGYFSLGLIHGHVGTDAGTAIAWSIAPATLGNLIGGVVFVSLLFWYTYGSNPKSREALENAHVVATSEADIVHGSGARPAAAPGVLAPSA
jgi:formate/nitrite transporter